MKLQDLINIEHELVEGLRGRASEGDNEAAQVLLEHLRAQSEVISKWKEAKVASEKKRKTE